MLSWLGKAAGLLTGKYLLSITIWNVRLQPAHPLRLSPLHTTPSLLTLGLRSLWCLAGHFCALLPGESLIPHTEDACNLGNPVLERAQACSACTFTNVSGERGEIYEKPCVSCVSAYRLTRQLISYNSKSQESHV